MCVRSAPVSEAIPLGTLSTLTDQLVTLSDARPSDRISVTGHNTLEIFLDLCRRGFFHAVCRTGAQGPHTSDNSADSLWIVEAENAAELRTLLAKCGRDLRPHGTLLVSMKNETGGDATLLLGSVLLKCGFQPVRRLVTTERVLLLCQRYAAVAVQIAA